MATKTLILRPTSITVEDESLISFYPAETSMDKAHLLVNEEVPDDDSTCIIISPGGTVYYYFDYIMPSDLDNVTNFKMIHKGRAEVSSSSAGNMLSNSISIENNNYTMTGQTYGESVEYKITNCSIVGGDSSEEDFLNYFNTIKQNTAFYIKQSVGTATKNNPIRITQLYIEITYTTDTTTTYIKTNGSWVETPITIYEKNNGSWITSNLSNLATKKYVLKEVP